MKGNSGREAERDGRRYGAAPRPTTRLIAVSGHCSLRQNDRVGGPDRRHAKGREGNRSGMRLREKQQAERQREREREREIYAKKREGWRMPGWKNAHDNSAVGFVSSPSAIYAANPRTSLAWYLARSSGIRFDCVNSRPFADPRAREQPAGLQRGNAVALSDIPDEFRRGRVRVVEFIGNAREGKPAGRLKRRLKIARVKDRLRNDRYRVTMLRFRFRDR